MGGEVEITTSPEDFVCVVLKVLSGRTILGHFRFANRLAVEPIVFLAVGKLFLNPLAYDNPTVRPACLGGFFSSLLIFGYEFGSANDQ